MNRQQQEHNVTKMLGWQCTWLKFKQNGTRTVPSYNKRLAFGTDQGRWLMDQVGAQKGTDSSTRRRGGPPPAHITSTVLWGHRMRRQRHLKLTHRRCQRRSAFSGW